jgi:hypothetical protein
MILLLCFNLLHYSASDVNLVKGVFDLFLFHLLNILINLGVFLPEFLMSVELLFVLLQSFLVFLGVGKHREICLAEDQLKVLEIFIF